jgi:hypothetical protein
MTPHDVSSARERAEAILDLANREPIHEALGPHKFVESEFEHGAGRCDKCGGGPAADIHKDPIDPVAVLQRIAAAVEGVGPLWGVATALERIADEMEYKRRCGAFWRLYEWLRGFFYRYRPVDKDAIADKQRIEQLEVQLAGCTAAALGWSGASPAKPGDYGWSPAYQDVLDLRKRYESGASGLGELPE